MSRRARLEEEKQKQLNNELEEEENRLKAQRDRIYAPIVWNRLTSGIKIQDLQHNYFDDILEIIKECYFDEEVLCRNTNVKEDSQSAQSFLDIVLYYLKDRTSVIAIDETNEDKIAGFLVMKAMHKDDYSNVFTRVFKGEGEAHKKRLTFLNFIRRKSDVYTDFQCDVFLEYYLLCIRPEYRGKGLGFQLFLTGVDVARSLEIPVVMGVLTSWKLQKLAKKIGMKTVNEIYYTSWRDRFNDLIFEEPGVGNYTCSVMAGLVPPPPEPEPPPKVEEEEVKLTRDEKRKAKEKMKKKKK